MLAEPSPEPAERPGRRTQRWLIRAEDHTPFAYARGHDFYRTGDHVLWAHLSADGWLLSARSGTPIAYRTGSYFYDPDTHTPVFYEHS